MGAALGRQEASLLLRGPDTWRGEVFFVVALSWVSRCEAVVEDHCTLSKPSTRKNA